MLGLLPFILDIAIDSVTIPSKNLLINDAYIKIGVADGIANVKGGFNFLDDAVLVSVEP